MSQLIARQVLDRVNMKEIMYAPSYLNSFSEDMRQLAEADVDHERAEAEERDRNTMSAYGFTADEQKRKPFMYASGIAIIPVHGSLINRFGACFGYVTGYNFIRSQLNAAIADEDVKGIVLDINSGGGEVTGCFELVEDIYQARSEKPILGVIDAHCYSAAYAIGSACSKLVCTPTGGAGSVGVVSTHISVKKLLDSIGYEVTFIYAGAHKVDGNPYEDLSDEVKADIQASVDKVYEKFVLTVARNRQLEAQVVRDTEARCFKAEDAIDLGLIDVVETPHLAVSTFFTELSFGSTLQENRMEKVTDNTQAENAPVVEQASVEQAKQAERQRVSAILTCEEASGNADLANHLAFETELSVDAAKGILAAAKPSAEAAAPTANGNVFQQAMDADSHPEMSADEGVEGGQEMSHADMILGAHAAATGRKYN